MVLSNTQVEKVFNLNFSEPYKTVLIGGFSEPEYIPASADCPARVQYKADFVESALHETAHWCLAGEKRRKKIDYGYWYSPDDRDPIQQQKFYEVEYRPQALEWIFSSVAGVKFKPSVDNLALPGDQLKSLNAQFFAQLKQHAITLLHGELNQRSLAFIAAIQEASGAGLLSVQQIKEAKF